MHEDDSNLKVPFPQKHVVDGTGELGQGQNMDADLQTWSVSLILSQLIPKVGFVQMLVTASLLPSLKSGRSS